MRHSIVTTLLLTVALLFPILPSALASAGTVPTAREQRETLEAGGLPTAGDLGTGWTLLQAFSYESGAEFSFEAHESAYADRYGNRIYVIVGIYDRGSDTDALAFMDTLVSRDQDVLLPSDADPSAREIRELNNPSDCDGVARATGEDPLMYFYVGSMTCDDRSNNRAIWLMLSGVYEGDNFQDGVQAVLEIVLDTEPR